MQHQLGLPQSNIILTLPTWRQCQIPQVKELIQKNSTPPIQIPITSSCFHLGFWPAGSRSEVTMISSLDLINLLEWLTELRKTFYLLDYWFIIKGFNSGRARKEKHTGQSMGKNMGNPCSLSGQASINLHRPSSLEALRSLPFWVFNDGFIP